MDTLEFRLDRYDALPGALARTSVRDIRSVFPESALISLKGRRDDPLFVSILLHGNEPVGLDVLKRLQAWMVNHPLPRSLLIFVGNVRAAEAGQRMVEGRPDFNRLWDGGESPEHDLAARVLDEVRAAKPFAAIDLHNNTGSNPVYPCVHETRPEDLQMASLFAPAAMLTRNPPSMMGYALSKICPAITAECGRATEEAGIMRAFDFVLDMLHLDHWRGAPDRDVSLYEVTGRLEISPEAQISFEHDGVGDIELPANLEKWNFFERPQGSIFARLSGEQSPLRVVNDHGLDVTPQFLTRDDDRLCLTRDFTPAMLTTNETAIRADCLGYLMEKRSV